MLTVRFLPLVSACLLVAYMSFQQPSTVAAGQNNTDLQNEADIPKTTSAKRPLFSKTDESDFNDTETTTVAVSHTGKCIRRFAGIYAYCRYFIDRKWWVLVLILYRKTCRRPKGL